MSLVLIRLKASREFKAVLLTTGAVAVGLWAAFCFWKIKQRAVAEPRLALLEAKAEFSIHGAPQIRTQWKNVGTGPATVIAIWIVATDRSMSNTFVCFGDSAGSIPAGRTGDFWVELTETNSIPPWPALVIATEAIYQAPRGNLTETQRWVGVLPNHSRTNRAVSFEPIAHLEQRAFLSNSARLIEAKVAR